jgi:hypothetical protein
MLDLKEARAFLDELTCQTSNFKTLPGARAHDASDVAGLCEALHRAP